MSLDPLIARAYLAGHVATSLWLALGPAPIATPFGPLGTVAAALVGGLAWPVWWPLQLLGH
jgi:hypothetical protein